MRKILLLLLAMLTMFSVLAEEETIWTSDLVAAKAKAIKEKKSIFIVFEGSDWCPPCKLMDKEILSTDEFKKKIVENYVPVIIDFPRNTKQSKELKEQNEALGKLVGISAFPSVAVMDTDGKVYGFIRGYAPATLVSDFLEAIKAFEDGRKKRDVSLLDAAKAKTPAEKAMILDIALMALMTNYGIFEDWGNYGYDSEIDQMIAGDPDNKLHIKVKWCYREFVMQSRNALQNKDYPAALKSLEDFTKEFPDEMNFVQNALYTSAQIKALMQDLPGCLETLKKVVDMNPKSDTGTKAISAVTLLTEAIAEQANAKKKFDGDLKEDDKEPLKEDDGDQKK